MAENLNAITGLPEKPETIKINLPKSKNSYFPGADIQGEFETLGKYDTGLVHGMSQNDLRAQNQSDWAALANGYVQLATGIIGDIVGTPGYIYEGAGAVTGNSDEFDNLFIKAGEFIKDLGTDYFPIYTDETSQGLFRPFDGEWMGNTIAQFGPTVAMLGATFLTEGLMYPALAARLSKLGQAGKWISAAEKFIQSEAKLGRKLKSARMAGTSRLIEGGMEAYESFNTNYANLIREGKSDEEARQLAGDAAAKVWINNWILSAVDMLQFKGILDGLGTIGKFKSLKSPAIGLAYEMVSESGEEGFQFAVQQEASNEIKRKTGKIGYDTTILDEFIGGLGDHEMQQAMVQGALGGAVFTGAGKLAANIMDKYKDRLLDAQTAYAKNDKTALAEANFNNAMDYLKRFDAEGKLNLKKEEFKGVIDNPDVNPEAKKIAENMIGLIEFYEATRDSIEESDPDLKAAKLDNIMKQKFYEALFAESEQALNQLIEDNQSKRKALEFKLEELKKQEDSPEKAKLEKKYNDELTAIKEIDDTELEPASTDAQIKKEASESILRELKLNGAKEEAKKLETKKGKEEAKLTKQELAKEENLKEVSRGAAKIQTVADANLQKEAYKNDPDALAIIDKEIEKRSEEEIAGNPPPDLLDTPEDQILNTLYDYYKDKPFTAKLVYGVNNPEELKKALNIKETETKSEFPEEIEPRKEVGKKEPIVEKEKETPKTKELPKTEIPKTPAKVIKEDVEDAKKAREEESKDLQEDVVTKHVVDSNEELPNNYDDVEDTSNPEWAKSFDKALIKFKKERRGEGKDTKWVVGVRITNHKIGSDFSNNFIELDVEEVKPGIFKLNKQPEGYKLPDKMVINNYYTLRDSNGYPINSNYTQFFKDYDIEVLRNLYKYKNEPVFIEINPNDGFNSGKGFDEIKMETVIYINGQRKVIGVLSAFKGNHGASNALWETIRNDIFNEYSKTNSFPTGVFQYSKTTTIEKIRGGRHNTLFDKSNRSTPKSVLPSNHPLIFGVGYSIPGHSGSSTINTNLDKDNVDPEISGFVDDKVVRINNSAAGNIFMFSLNGAGELIPSRVFTKVMKNLPHLRNILLKEINKFRASEAIKIVKFKYEDSNGNLKTVPDFNDKMGSIYDKVQVGLNENGKLEFYRIYLGKNNEITKREPQKDSNGEFYNKRGFTQGAIVIDRSNMKIFRLENLVEGKWQVQELDKNFNEIGSVQSGEFLKNTINDGNLYLHYAYNYYRFYDMDNRPAQIDHKQVNTGNYNNIVNERLESDLVPGENFHSTKFSLDINSLVKPKEEKTERKDKVEIEQKIDVGVETSTKEELITKKIEPNYVKVEQFQIKKEGDKYYFKNGEEVVDETTINKYEVKANYDPSRVITYNNAKYYVLPDNKIISLAPSSKGKERFKSGTTRDKILSQLESPSFPKGEVVVAQQTDKYITGNHKYQRKKEIYDVVVWSDEGKLNILQPREGYKVTIEGLPYNFFVSKIDNAWYSTEESSGLSVGGGKTIEEAIQTIKNKFTGTTRDVIEKMVSEAAEKKKQLSVKQDLNKPGEVVEEKEERMSLSDLRKLRKQKSTKGNNTDPLYGETPPKFMSVNQAKTRRTWNKEEELSWLNSKLSSVPTFVHNRLFWLKQWGVNGYGVFYNSAINLIENAQEGTTYHEAFHAAFNLYLNNSEQSKLLSDAKSKYSVAEREIEDMIKMIQESSGITLSREQAINEVLEDKMADDFMKYVLAKQAKIKEINNLPFLKRLGEKILNFFNELFETASTIIGNKNVIDKFFYNIQRGKYNNKTFVRNIDSVTPKFRKHPNYPNPGEYQEVVDVTTSLLIDSIEEHKKLNPEITTKSLVVNNLIPPKSSNLSDYDNNLLFSVDLPHSLYNKILNQIDKLEEDGMLTEEKNNEFDKFISSFMTVSPDGLQIRPKLLAFDILRNLSKSGIIINLDTSTFLEDAELGQGELEENNDDLLENSDFRDSWQLLTFSISQFEKLGQKLRLTLNNIPVVEWLDQQQGTISSVEGYLGYSKRYTIGHVYNQLIQKLGNSFSKENMISKFTEASKETPMMKQIYDTFINNEEFIGELWIHIGQKNHPKFVTVLQDGSDDNISTKVIPTNSLGQTNKITENIISNIYANSPLYNKDGSVNKEAGIEFKKKFDEFKKISSEFAGSIANVIFPEEYMITLGELFKLAEIDISTEKLISVNNRQLKSFTKAIVGKSPSFYSYIDLIAEGKDPIDLGNSGIKDFVKVIKSAYDYDVQDAHKNPSGGQVHEWIDGNFEGRLINQLKDKEAALKFIEDMQQDEYYKHSPLLNLLKKALTNVGDSSMYFMNPSKIDYVVFSDTKLKGEQTGTEYKDMSERQLYITILASYFNSNHFDGTAYLPLPVPSDSYSLTGIQIPVIKNVDYSGLDGKKGILDYIYDIAYQEFTKVKLNRDTTKNQKKKERDVNGNLKFVYFDILEQYPETKKRLLEQDLTTTRGQKVVRRILEAAVRASYKQALKEEVRKLRDLDIIEKTDTGWKWKDNLLNNTPLEPFVEHFVANWMLFQHEFQTVFNGDISYYKNISNFFKRAKQTWSPGVYLDTSVTRPFYNVKILNTNEITPTDEGSSFKEIEAAINELFKDDPNLAQSLINEYKSIDETDGQSYIDLYRYKEQQKGLYRWDDQKEKAYRRLLKGEFNVKDYNVIFNVNKPFYFGLHRKGNEIIPTQNKNSEFVMIPAFANPNNAFYNPKYRQMLEDMGYTFNEDGSIDFDEIGRESGKHTDQFVFDSAVKVGLYGQGNIETALTHQFNNSDWRLQMETPVHHIDDKVLLATQLRKHMMNNLDMNETYTLSNNIEYEVNGVKVSGKSFKGRDILKIYNDVLIKDINSAFESVIEKFNSFDDLINTLREEVIKRDLGDQYLQALDTYKEESENGIITKTKLPLWHPLHLYRVESMLNSIIKNNVTKQKLDSGVTLVNLSSYGFDKKPKIVFKEDKSIDYLEAYVPVYDTKLYQYADENGLIDVKAVEKVLGKKALRGLVWRIPNEDKYSTFTIRIIGFLPAESGGAIVLPPEVTKIAGLD